VPVTEVVSVLCGTKKPEYAEMVDVKKFSDLLVMARELFRYVLIDLPRGFGPISIAACEASDITYLAANLETGFEISHMQRALEIFEDWQDSTSACGRSLPVCRAMRIRASHWSRTSATR
jgi:pilus assembly protein CpaE